MSKQKTVKFPTVITSRWLRAHSACEEGLGRFKRLFGGRMELTVENLQKGWKVLGKEKPLHSEYSDAGNCRSDIAFLASEVLEPGSAIQFGSWPLQEAAERAHDRAFEAGRAKAEPGSGSSWMHQAFIDADIARTKFLYRALVKAVKAREAAAA